MGFSKLMAPIGDQQIFLGHIQWWLNADSMNNVSDRGNEYILHSSASIGDLLIERKIERVEPVDRNKILCIFIGSALDLSGYENVAVEMSISMMVSFLMVVVSNGVVGLSRSD